MHYMAHRKVHEATKSDESLAPQLCSSIPISVGPTFPTAAASPESKNNTPKHTFVSRPRGGVTDILALKMEQRRTFLDANRRAGIVTGILFIAATAAGALSMLMQPILDAPDYLTKISANEPKVLTGALLLFIMGWAGAGIGISMYPILRRHNEGLALGAAGFRIIEGVFDGIGAVLILLLASLSREFIKAGPTGLAQFQNLGALLAEGRTWVGDVGALPAWCIGAYLYYSLFYRTRLVPRWLSVWGLVGITLTVIASILVLFRQIVPLSTVQLLMNLPIAPQEIVLAIWLIVKGFNPSAMTSQQRRAT